MTIDLWLSTSHRICYPYAILFRLSSSSPGENGPSKLRFNLAMAIENKRFRHTYADSHPGRASMQFQLHQDKWAMPRPCHMQYPYHRPHCIISSNLLSSSLSLFSIMNPMLYMSPPDLKSSRFLVIYCVISTLLCFHLLHLTKFNAVANAVAPVDCPHSLFSLALNTSQHSRLFPSKIWQTSRTGPAELDENDLLSVHSWVKMNPKHRYEILTQYSAESYVKTRFSHRPDIQEIFVDLQDPILRADSIRYLVLLGDGGVYSDIDTTSLKPIEDWVPSAYVNQVNLVVGVEYDKLDGDRWGDWPLDLQFCTWAILAKPGHLLMEMTVDRVISRLKALAQEQETTVSGLRASFDDVLNTTGPALFTEAVIEGLADTTGTNFTWQNITGMTESKLVEDGTYFLRLASFTGPYFGFGEFSVTSILQTILSSCKSNLEMAMLILRNPKVLILPINAFGSGQEHSNSGSPDEDTALVQHLFKGSWKADHPRKEAKQPQG